MDDQVQPDGASFSWNYGTNAIRPEAATAAARRRAEAGDSYYLRTREEITGFFGGLELLEPGVVFTSQWRPDHLWRGQQSPPVNAYCGVARKP